MSFQLDDRLARDTFVIGDLPLCRLLLMNDARWPWLILVPRREGMVELIDLELADQTQLMDEAGRGPTRSMSARLAISCASFTCILSRGLLAIRPGLGRYGGIAPRCPTTTAPSER